MRFVKLRYLLFVGMTLVSIVPIIILGSGVQKPVLQKELDAVNEKHLLMAKTLTSAISRYVADVEAVFRYAFHDKSAGKFPAGISQLIQPLQFRHICVVDLKGAVLRGVIVPGVEPRKNISEKVMEVIRGRLVMDDVTFSGVLPGPDGDPAIYVAMLLTDELIALGTLSTEYLQDLQQIINFGDRGHAAIVDQTGKVLSHPNKEWVLTMKDISAVKPVRYMIGGERGVTIFYSPATKQTMVAGYDTVPKVGWGAMVPQPMMELEEDAYYLFETTLKIIAVGILSAALISWCLAGYLARPVRAVANAAREMAKGKQGARVSLSKSSPVELQSLAESFNSMVEEISATSEALRHKSSILQTTLDHMAEGITLVDRNRNLVLANQRFADFFELPADLLKTPVPLNEILAFLAQRGEFGPFENLDSEVPGRLRDFLRANPYRKQHQRPGGATIELSGVPLPDGSKVTSYVDVTERTRTEETLRDLQEISANQLLGFEARLQALLATGRRQFKLANGILSRVTGRDYVIVQAATQHEFIKSGRVFDVGDTYCEEVLKTNQLECFERAGHTRWKSHPCYHELKLEAYIAIPVVVDRAVYGTLNFSSTEPRCVKFSSTDKELMGLMAQWVGGEIMRDNAMHALIEEKERALVTLHSIGDAVITTNSEGTVQYINPVAEELTGWSLKAGKGQPLDRVFHILDENTRQRMTGLASGFVKRQILVAQSNTRVLVRRDQKEYTIEESIAPILVRPNSLLGLVLVFRDVTESQRLSRELTYQATHDALTGLVNRGEFERRLEGVLQRARIEKSEHALCYLDLDQFKIINDTCGHAAGDALLKQLGALLPEHIGKCDTLARLGGDEFGVLMEYCPLNEAVKIAETLLKTIKGFRFLWREKIFSIGVSIGVVPLTNTSDGIVAVLGAADGSCYTAKDMGRNRIHVYREDDEQLVQRRGEMEWVTRLPRAIEENRLQLYYQPIYPVHGGVWEGDQCEILLRMKNEEGQIISPGAFLPAAERYGLSVQIDRWVINATFNWLISNPNQLRNIHLFSINLSGHSLCDGEFLHFLTRCLKESGIPPKKICFEITETAAIANLSSAISFINALHALGCKFALDDFGSGVSSFAYLKNLPVDFLKIDGLFVKDILDDPVDRSMIQSINHIGHLMNKKTIAEFVENEQILDALRQIGVDYCQGYAIGYPKSLASMEADAFYQNVLQV